ncbi:TIGR01777 family oxidoreductase [Candidatus Poriferisodalis sp.]|uniref:TIGR01777 family oxidoreductase n=1 Tax=Candidatus Poriferisodalis sp. TaxID=3101277 RepID=UPI003B52570D
MRVAITGIRGLIGGALAASLRADGHEVLGVSRRPGLVAAVGRTGEASGEARETGVSEGPGAAGGTAVWDVAAGSIDAAALEGLDAIVHLAGESIGGRWSDKRKAAIMSSRVESTKLLADTVRSLDTKPSVFICGSAVGFYGNRGDEELTELSLPGDGFLAEVCKRWERAAVPIADAGVRLVRIRTGLVVGPGAEAIERMARITRLGAGGPLGGGRQWWSWISLDDEVRAIRHLIDSDVSGAFNLTAPNPVRQRDFQRALSAALRRPSFMPAPKFAIGAALGEMGQALLLDSTRVLPDALTDDGFEFAHPELSGALSNAL